MGSQRIRADTGKTETQYTRMRPQPPKGMELHPVAAKVGGIDHFVWYGGGRLWGCGLPQARSTKFTFLPYQVVYDRPVSRDGVWFWSYTVRLEAPRG